MRIIKNEVWSVEGQDSKELLLSKNQVGDSVVSDLFINPLADCTVVVTGYVSSEDENGTVLTAVDMGLLSKAEDITEKGIYQFPVSAFWKVKIDVTGTADIVLKTLY